MKKARKGGDMFAPAEEFSEMLEENADDVMTGSQTLINRDRAGKLLNSTRLKLLTYLQILCLFPHQILYR